MTPCDTRPPYPMDIITREPIQADAVVLICLPCQHMVAASTLRNLFQAAIENRSSSFIMRCSQCLTPLESLRPRFGEAYLQQRKMAEQFAGQPLSPYASLKEWWVPGLLFLQQDACLPVVEAWKGISELDMVFWNDCDRMVATAEADSDIIRLLREHDIGIMRGLILALIFHQIPQRIQHFQDVLLLHEQHQQQSGQCALGKNFQNFHMRSGCTSRGCMYCVGTVETCCCGSLCLVTKALGIYIIWILLKIFSLYLYTLVFP